MHLSNYAEDGLRTLVFAYRRIDASEYERWSAVFTKAKATVCPERDELLENASEMIERDLILLGAVAVEDKLQNGVCSMYTYVYMLIFLCESWILLLHYSIVTNCRG